MKRLLIFLLLFISVTITPSMVFAQGMMDWTSTPSGASSDNHTAREEAEGKEIWEKLQAKEVTCETLKDGDFGALGEYFMGQMVGDSHEAMNTMMERMMGKEGEEQMHVVMGKRLSGCGYNAQVLQMMGYGGWNNMMGGWNGFGFLGWLPLLLFWILIIFGVVALARYLGGTTRGGNKERSTLEILKERYAKGEIDKKEFEQMKKDLV